MIVVLGGTGMVGRSLSKIMDGKYLGSKDCDLRDEKATFEYLDSCEPEHIIHLACDFGGSTSHSENYYSYYINNVLINTNVIHYCVINNIPLLAVSSAAVYPANKLKPTEGTLHDGRPLWYSYSYAFAKRMIEVQCRAAKDQYGFDYTIVYPANLYGPFSEYNGTKSHLIPSLICKMLLAKQSKEDVFINNTSCHRQFMYVDDFAKILTQLIKMPNRNVSDLNIAYPTSHSVGEVAAIIAEVTGYTDKIQSVSEPTSFSLIDTDRFSEMFPDFEFTNLKDGIKKTYDWVKEKMACGV